MSEIHILGNFEKPRRYKNGRPRDWFNRKYKAIIKYPFSWRHETKKHKCTCVEVIETYMPYYGWSFYHEEACDFSKKHYLNNLIAQSE